MYSPSRILAPLCHLPWGVEEKWKWQCRDTNIGNAPTGNRKCVTLLQYVLNYVLYYDVLYVIQNVSQYYNILSTVQGWIRSELEVSG